VGNLKQVNDDFYKDIYFVEKCSFEERAFILHLITIPPSTISGVYKTTLVVLAAYLSLDVKTILKYFEKFEKDGRAMYRDGWVCVKNRYKFNKLSNDNIKSAVSSQLDKCPDFIKDFLSIEKPLEGFQSILKLDINKNININTNTSTSTTRKTKKKGVFEAGVFDEIRQYFIARHEETGHGKYMWLYGSDDGHLSTMLKVFGKDGLKSKIDIFLQSNDIYLIDKRGYTVTTLLKEINKISDPTAGTDFEKACKTNTTKAMDLLQRKSLKMAGGK
jgi:hypothetical protein